MRFHFDISAVPEDIYYAALLKCEREREMTEFQMATLELQRWSIYVAAGVGVAQCALIGYWIYIMHLASKRRNSILANQEKMLDTVDRTHRG